MDGREKNPNLRKTLLITAYIIVLTIGTIFNIRINYLGKGGNWDLYPIIEILWLIASVLISLKVSNYKTTIH